MKGAASFLVVAGAINGRDVGVMLDTGAGTMILRSAADRLGLVRRAGPGPRLPGGRGQMRLFGSGGDTHAFGVGGETYVEARQVDEFRLGQVTRSHWGVAVAGEGDFGRSIDMILGEDFLEQYEVEFDLPHDAVRLFESANCEHSSLAYWAPRGANELDLYPYYNAGLRIVVPARINDQPIDAELDSGAGASVLDKPVAERLGIRSDSPEVVLAGTWRGLGAKPVDYWISPLRSFVIGNETIGNTVIRFADLWKDATFTPKGSRVVTKISFTPALLLSVDFLRAHRVLVAHSQRKMYFSYEGGPIFQGRSRVEAAEPVRHQENNRGTSDRG